MSDSRGADPFDSVFPPTSPPPLSDVDLSRVGQLASIGVLAVRAALFDPATGALRGSWRMNKYGEVGEYSSVDWKDHFAIGTLAQVSRGTAAQPLTHSVNPWRWEFAWHVGDRLVALARARYELPQSERTPAHTPALVQICEAGLQLQARDERSPATAPAPLAEPEGARAAAAPRVPRRAEPGSDASTTARAATLPRPARPLLWLLLLLCVASTAAAFIGDHEAAGLQADMQRQHARGELTMIKRIDEKMSQGDFGEVQAELDAFQELDYFDRAVVTNGQGRAVALTGQVRSVRIGNPVPADVAAGSNVVTLGPGGQPGRGQLITWPTARSGPTLDSQRLLLIACGVLSAAAALATAALLLLLGRPSARRQPSGRH